MKITEINIQNFRSLKDITISDIKPLNVFIGKNGSGKSHILEALELFFEDFDLQQKIEGNFEENLWYDRDNNNPIKFKIRFELSTKSYNEIFDDKTLSEINDSLKSKIRNDFTIERHINGNKWVNFNISVGSCKFLSPKEMVYGKNQDILIKLTKLIKGTFKLCNANRESASSRRNRGYYNEFGRPSSKGDRPFIIDNETIDYLTEIGQSPNRNESKRWAKHQSSFNDFSSYQIEMRGDTVHYKQEDLYLPLNLLGGGDQEILILERLLSLDANSIYGIEEPETRLHAGYQRKLLNKFKKVSENKQLFITTHSPVFVDRIDFNNSSIWSVTKEGKTTNVERVDIKVPINLKQILTNLDIRMSDIFFAEKLLFVEGATEREIIPMIAEKLNINLIHKGVEIIAMRGMNTGKYHIEMWHHISKNAHLPTFYVFDGDAKKELNDSKNKGYITNDNHHILSEKDIEDLYPEELTKDAIISMIPSIDKNNMDLSIPRKNKLDIIFKKNNKKNWKLELGRNVVSKMSKEQVSNNMDEFRQIFDKF